MKIKESLKIGVLALLMLGMTACSSFSQSHQHHRSDLMSQAQERDLGKSYLEGFMMPNEYSTVHLDSALPDPTEDYFYQGDSRTNRWMIAYQGDTPCDDSRDNLEQDMDQYQATFDKRMQALNQAFGGQAPKYVNEGAKDLHDKVIQHFEDSLSECGE